MNNLLSASMFYPAFARRLLRGLAVTTVMALSLHASAETLSAADEKQVRAVVEAQLKAFEKNDAKKAYSYAAPNVREVINSPESFMAMVQQDYPVVYRHRSVAFLKPEIIKGDVIQRVQMTDEAGDEWVASYGLQRQKDKSWRIAGCVVAESKGKFI